MKQSAGRFASLLFAASLLLAPLAGCAAAPQEAESYPQRPAMWEVAAPEGGDPLYLLGSIHAAEEALFPLNTEILDAFEACHSLAVEVDVVPYTEDTAKAMEMAPYMMYMDGGSITDEIDAELVAQVQEVLTVEEVDLGVPMEMTNMFRPYTFVSLLSGVAVEKAGLSAEQGVDLYFLGLAREQEKPILEVESMASQLEMFLEFSPEIQTYLLREGLKVEEAGQGVRELYDAWKVGDLDKLLALAESEEEADGVDPAVLEEYNRAMVSDRNTLMSDVAEEYLRDGGGVFYVVGALHMVGEDGIVQQLRDRGYEVKRV